METPDPSSERPPATSILQHRESTRETRAFADLPLDLRTAGPGHLTGTAMLPAKGDWQLTVTVRVSDFDEDIAHVVVPIK